MKQYSRYQTAWRILIFWTLFVGIGAVGGEFRTYKHAARRKFLQE